MNKGSFKLWMLAIGMLGMFPAAWAQSLGDLAREVRKSHPAQALKVYTNEDIPQVSNEVVWKSAASAAQTTPSMPGIAMSVNTGWGRCRST